MLMNLNVVVIVLKIVSVNIDDCVHAMFVCVNVCVNMVVFMLVFVTCS